MLMCFDQACDITLDIVVQVHYVKHYLKKIVHDLQNWTDEMIVTDPDLNDINQTKGTIMWEPQYIFSCGRPHTIRSRRKIKYHFPSSQLRMDSELVIMEKLVLGLVKRVVEIMVAEVVLEPVNTKVEVTG